MFLNYRESEAVSENKRAVGKEEQEAAPFKLGKRKKQLKKKISDVKFLMTTTEEKELLFGLSKCGQVAALSSGRPTTVIWVLPAGEASWSLPVPSSCSPHN